MVQCVTGLDILTAQDMFVMRWIPDLSAVRTPTVRMSAPVTTALMLTAPQASTVLIPAKGRLQLRERVFMLIYFYFILTYA